MSQDGLDDELIALVGEDDQSEPPSRAAAPAHGGAGGRRSRRKALLGDLSDDEEEEEQDPHPYPLEGIFKDEDDREWLLGMNELEREEVLSQRRDELSRRQQQAQLAAMVRSQQAAAKSKREEAEERREAARAKRRKRSHEQARRELEDLRDDTVEEDDVFRESDESEEDEEEDEEPAPRRGKSAKAATLSDLRRARAQKQRGARAESSDDEAPAAPRRRRRALLDSDEEASESEYEDEVPAYTRRGTRSTTDSALAGVADEPPSLEQLNALRVGRDQLERMLFVSNWRDVFRGCFVRCSWGMRDRADGQGKEHVYRVHQITDIQLREGKYYDISPDHSGRWLNAFVTVVWNGREHQMDLRPLSTQPISDSERQRWIAALRANDTKFPSGGALQEKQEQLDAFLSAPLTEEDIRKMIQAKKELRAGAEASGAAGAAARRHAQRGDERLVRYDEHAMAQINERNRRMDRERIQEAERRAALAKRAGNADGAGSAPAAAPAAPDVSAALAAAPAGTAVLPTIDIDLGDF